MSETKNATEPVASAEETAAIAAEEASTASGLAQLAKKFGDLSLEVLDITPQGTLEDINKGIDEIIKTMDRIRGAVTNGLKLKSEVNALVARITDSRRRRVATEQIKGKLDEAEGQIEVWLTHKVPHFRLSAALAYLQYCLGQVFKTTDEARKMLVDLEGRKLILKVDKDNKAALVKPGVATFQIGYDDFILGTDFGFEAEDAKEISRWIGEYSRKLTTLVGQERKKTVEKMEADAKLTPEDVWDGKENGICLFKIPPESYLDNKGKERWLGGGPLLVRATAKDIIPISGEGGALEKQVKLMAEMALRLPRHTLQWDCPPGGHDTKTSDRYVDGIMRTRDISSNDVVAYLNKMRMLWHILMRHYHAADTMIEQAKLKEEFKAATTITPEAFFGLNGSDRPENGDALLELENSYQVDGKPAVFCPFALVRRASNGDRSVIEVLRIAPHTHDMLGGVIGKQYSEGDNFKEVPGYLRRFLRAVMSRIEMAHTVDQDIS